jgi:hypothetical protein
MSTLRTTDAEIVAAAITRLGCQWANVFSIISRANNWADETEAVRWHWLAVERGDGWELIGRRRTRGELLAMVEKRTAWESTRPTIADPERSQGCHFW